MSKKDEALKLARHVMHNQGDIGVDEWIATEKAIDEALAEQSAQQESVNKYCCHLCFNKSGQVFLDRMILCPKCGNKRCPKATHHGLPCTKSNDLGQKGSIYDQPAQQQPVAYIHRQGNHYEVSERFLSDDEKSRGWTEEPLYTSPPAQQEHVERGGLRFYTNGIERQHWKADGSIDFKDKQGNVTMTIAAGSITSPPASKPLTQDMVESCPYHGETLRGAFFDGWIKAEAAHGIKENT